MTPRLDDTAANIAKVCDLSGAAARDGARLILFPEGCLTGNAFPPVRQPALDAVPDSFAPLIETARRGGIVICAGFVAPFGDRFNVAHAIVLPDGRVLFQRKAACVNGEPAHLTAWPDPARAVFTLDGFRVAIAICSEYGLPHVETALATARPAVILHPSAGRMTPDELAPHGARSGGFHAQCRRVVELAAAEVKSRGVPKLSANPIGFDGHTWWPGNSYAVGADGVVLAWIPGENDPARMKPAVSVFDLPEKPS